MKVRTIAQAIVEVLGQTSTPKTPSEIYDEIIRQNLYTFNTKSPIVVINSEIRKSSIGIDLKKSKSEKLFEPLSDGRYALLKK